MRPLGQTRGSVLCGVHLGLGSNQDHLAGRGLQPCPPQDLLGNPALALCSSGWARLDPGCVGTLVPGSLGHRAGEGGVLGWDRRGGGENSCSVRLRLPPSTGACLPIWASLLSGPTVGPYLFCSQNKRDHNLRKTTLCPSVPLGIRDDGGIFLRPQCLSSGQRQREGGPGRSSRGWTPLPARCRSELRSLGPFSCSLSWP